MLNIKNIEIEKSYSYGITNLQKLLAENKAPSREIYGEKTLGLYVLNQIKNKYNLDFIIPQSLIIPADFNFNQGGALLKLKAKLKNFVAQFDQNVVVILRSSSVDETPGKYKSIPMLFNQKQFDQSFAAFITTAQDIIANQPKAIVVQQLAGAITKQYVEGVEVNVVGRNNISFYADSHNPINRNLALISAVQGLPSLIADTFNQSILIDIDKQTERVVSIISADQDTSYYLSDSQVGNFDQYYRQQQIDLFVLEQNKFVRMNKELAGRFTRGIELAIEPIHENYHRYYKKSPFSDFAQIKQITQLTKILSNELCSPVEIEGTYTLAQGISTLYILQLRQYPKDSLDSVNLSSVIPEKLIAQGDFVLGTGTYNGPLVLLNEPDGIPKISRLNFKQFFPEGCAVISSLSVSQSYDQLFSPVSQARVVIGRENTLSHIRSGFRTKMANENNGYIYMSIRHELKDRIIRLLNKNIADTLAEGVYIINDIGLESNGQSSQIFFQ